MIIGPPPKFHGTRDILEDNTACARAGSLAKTVGPAAEAAVDPGLRFELRIPIRGTFADRSVPAIASALTQVMIDPTVRQATRISSRTAVLEQHTLNQATVSSKAYVGPAP